MREGDLARLALNFAGIGYLDVYFQDWGFDDFLVFQKTLLWISAMPDALMSKVYILRQ